MHNDSASHDGVGTVDGDVAVNNVDYGDPVVTGGDVSKVTGVAHLIGWGPVGGAVGVEVSCSFAKSDFLEHFKKKQQTNIHMKRIRWWCHQTDGCGTRGVLWKGR